MNGEKLFKSMNNINQEWIEQAKPANKPVIMRTRSKYIEYQQQRQPQ